MRTRVGWPLAGVLAVVVAALTLALVRAGPDYALVGPGVAGAMLEMVAGASLAAAGVVVARLGDPRAALLLLAAAVGFLAEEWATPVTPGALGFGLGLIVAGLSAPLAAHAALGSTVGARQPAGALLVLLYAGAVLAGPLAGLVLMPDRHGCGDCPANPFALADAPALAQQMIRAGDVATIAAAGALVGVAVWRLARSRPAVRPVDAPILVASVLVLAAAVAVASGQLRDLAALDPSARDAQAVALLALGLAFGWRGVLRVHRRAALVGIVARVAAAPAPGRLREALAALIGDPQLRLAFPLDGWGTMIDTDGRPAPPTPARAQVTRLARDGRPLVALVHRRGLVEEPSLAREVAATAGLVVEHERVRAEERARLRELHASRVRLVSAGDAERRRLERDLHDGAQQRLVGLAMTLGSAPDAAAPTEARPQLAIARARLEDAVAELRTLARGIFPPALAVEGLAAALEDLAYAAPVRVRVAPWSIGRTDPVVEATAYLVATLAVRHAPPTGIALRVETEANALRLVAEPSWPPAVELDELAERVAALDGRLLADAGRVHVELPCVW